MQLAGQAIHSQNEICPFILVLDRLFDLDPTRSPYTSNLAYQPDPHLVPPEQTGYAFTAYFFQFLS